MCLPVLFPGACSKSEMEDTMSAFLNLMTAYTRGRAYHDISLDTEPDCYRGIIIVQYDAEAGRLRVLNPFWNAPTEVQENMRRLERERREPRE